MLWTLIERMAQGTLPSSTAATVKRDVLTRSRAQVERAQQAAHGRDGDGALKAGLEIALPKLQAVAPVSPCTASPGRRPS